MSEKLSELVEKLEKENDAYNKIITNCMLIDYKYFTRIAGENPAALALG